MSPKLIFTGSFFSVIGTAMVLSAQPVAPPPNPPARDREPHYRSKPQSQFPRTNRPNLNILADEKSYMYSALLFFQKSMNMSVESLLVILFVGLVAGWLAGQIVRGYGFGLFGDIVVGIIGAFIGGWLLPRLGVHIGVGLVASIFDATIGAIVLLLILRLVRGGGEGARWGSWSSRRY